MASDDLNLKVKFTIDTGSFKEVDDAIRKINERAGKISVSGTGGSQAQPSKAAREPSRDKQAEIEAYTKGYKETQKSIEGFIRAQDSAKKIDPVYRGLKNDLSNIRNQITRGRAMGEDVSELKGKQQAYKEEVEKGRQILATKEQVRETGFLNTLTKKWRQSITGVLIDLHMLRVVGQSSKVVSAMFEVLSKSMGYVVDMVLLPALPLLLDVARLIRGVGHWFAELNPVLKKAIGTGVLLVGGFFIMLNTVRSAYNTLIWFRTWVKLASDAARDFALKHKTGVPTTTGGGGDARGMSAFLTSLIPILIPIAAAVAVAVIAIALTKILDALEPHVKPEKKREWGAFRTGQEMIPGLGPVISATRGKSSNPWAVYGRMFGYMIGDKNLMGLASGGLLKSGQAAVVGEKGPELLIPGSGGYNVVPNHGLRFLAEGTGDGILSTLLDSIGGLGDWLGTEIKNVMDGVGGFVGGIFSKSISGGGVDTGVGTTLGDSQKAIMSKGFATQNAISSSGFKNANTLLAAILAALMQGLKGAGGETPEVTPEPVDASSIWELIGIPIPKLASDIWNLVTKVVDVLSTKLWNLVLSPVTYVSSQLWKLVEPVAKIIPFPWTLGSLAETTVKWPWALQEPGTVTVKFPWTLAIPIVETIAFPWKLGSPTTTEVSFPWRLQEPTPDPILSTSLWILQKVLETVNSNSLWSLVLSPQSFLSSQIWSLTLPTTKEVISALDLATVEAPAAPKTFQASDLWQLLVIPQQFFSDQIWQVMLSAPLPITTDMIVDLRHIDPDEIADDWLDAFKAKKPQFNLAGEPGSDAIIIIERKSFWGDAMEIPVPYAVSSDVLFPLTPVPKTSEDLYPVTNVAKTTDDLITVTPVTKLADALFTITTAVVTASALFSIAPITKLASELFGITMVPKTSEDLYPLSSVAKLASDLFTIINVSKLSSDLFSIQQVVRLSSDLFAIQQVVKSAAEFFVITAVSKMALELFQVIPSPKKSDELFPIITSAKLALELFTVTPNALFATDFFGVLRQDKTSNEFYNVVPTDKTAEQLFNILAVNILGTALFSITPVTKLATDFFGVQNVIKTASEFFNIAPVVKATNEFFNIHPLPAVGSPGSGAPFEWDKVAIPVLAAAGVTAILSYITGMKVIGADALSVLHWGGTSLPVVSTTPGIGIIYANAMRLLDSASGSGDGIIHWISKNILGGSGTGSILVQPASALKVLGTPTEPAVISWDGQPKPAISDGTTGIIQSNRKSFWGEILQNFGVVNLWGGLISGNFPISLIGGLIALTGFVDAVKQGVKEGTAAAGGVATTTTGSGSHTSVPQTYTSISNPQNQGFKYKGTANIGGQNVEVYSYTGSGWYAKNSSGNLESYGGAVSGISQLPAATTTSNPTSTSTATSNPTSTAPATSNPVPSTPSASNPVVTVGATQGTNLNYTSAQWSAMDANARQQLVNSGQVYTVGGVQYKNGSVYDPSKYGGGSGGGGSGGDSSPVTISNPVVTTTPAGGYNWLAYDGGKKYGMTRTPDGDDASLVEITTEQFKNQILERANTPVYSNKSGTGNNLNAWPKSVIFPYSTSVLANKPTKKLFLLQTERIGGIISNDKVAAYHSGSNWTLNLQQRPYMNEWVDYKLWKTIANSDLSNLMGGTASERIPGLALGGRAISAGLAWVGERGRELMALPKGAEVMPHTPSMDLLAKQTKPQVVDKSVHYNFDGAVFQVSGKDERQLFEEFMRMMERESRRVRG